MRVQSRTRFALAAGCLAALLTGCGPADETSQSTGTAAGVGAGSGADAGEAPQAKAGALGGAALPKPESAAQRITDPTLPPALTPATNNTKPSTDERCYKAPTTACQMEIAVVQLLNAHREATRPLALDAKLSYVARAWSDQQQVIGAIGHAGFPDVRELTYLAEFDNSMPFFLGAENVGTTYGTDKLTVEQLAGEIVEMWWGSRGHRANIVGEYAVVGIGISISSDARTVMATALFGAE